MALTFESYEKKEGEREHDRILDIIVEGGERADSAGEEKTENDEGEADFQQQAVNVVLSRSQAWQTSEHKDSLHDKDRNPAKSLNFSLHLQWY